MSSSKETCVFRVELMFGYVTLKVRCESCLQRLSYNIKNMSSSDRWLLKQFHPGEKPLVHTLEKVNLNLYYSVLCEVFASAIEW